MKSPQKNKFQFAFHPVLWLAVALAVVSTSCASTSGSNSYNPNGVWPVKGATLLMQRP